MVTVDFKLYIDGMDKLLEQINQATVELSKVQNALNQELGVFECSLRGSSQNVFKECSDNIKAGIVSQKDILTEAKNTGLAAKKALTEVDAQIAAGINVEMGLL